MKVPGVLVCLGLAARVTGQEAGPVQIPFSTQTFGEDGPWPAVEVTVGANNDLIHLLPGGWYEADVFSKASCAGSSDCPAAKSGLYDVDASNPWLPPGQVLRDGFLDQYNAEPEINKTGQAELMMDSVSISSLSGRKFEVPHHAISKMDSVTITLPDGRGYMPQIGFLGLGSPTDEGAYALKNKTRTPFQIIPGWLHENNVTRSNSFGLHYGSVAYGQPASLIFGGYDRSRILGDVGVYQLSGVSDGEPMVDMVDVSISVIQGSSPFNTTNIGSLYHPGNSRNTSSQMSLNPTVPYMQLPLGTCEAVAEWLPVTMNSNLGLYVWNIDDPQYKRILSSGASLDFSLAQSGKDNLVIKVPFSLLNLTLTAPLVDKPTPYFPCKPSYSLDGRYYLGRAFLQAAYLATNWNMKTFFVAQAPGPDCDQANILSFSDTDVTMKASDATALASSWQNHWSELAKESDSASNHNTSSTVLGIGAIVGIAVGGAVVLCVLVLGWYCFVRRRRRQRVRVSVHEWYGGAAPGGKLKKLSSRHSGNSTLDSKLPRYSNPPRAYAPGEMEGSKRFSEPYKAELGSTHIAEMQTRPSSDQPCSRPPIEIHGREVGLVFGSMASSRSHQDGWSEISPNSLSPMSSNGSKARHHSSTIRKSLISAPLETRMSI